MGWVFSLALAIIRGWHYNLRHCWKVGLITNCEIPCSRDEIHKVEVRTDERWHYRPRLTPSMTNARVQKGEKRGAVRGSIRCSAVCGLDLCSLVAHTPEGGGVLALVLRLFVSLQAARQISMRQKKALHCASWIDAVWEHKHQRVPTGSGRRSRRSSLRQLARRSRDLGDLGAAEGG
jgi:hypothetical protein